MTDTSGLSQTEILKECMERKEMSLRQTSKIIEQWNKIVDLEEENRLLESINSKLYEEVKKKKSESLMFKKSYKNVLKKYIKAKELAVKLKKELKKYQEFWEENKKLKSDLEECECSMHFENDEVWFWKREYKKLKKWIKDHCKWYWNLFPEDEMKRQWKKADKKRK